jgi:HemY protein
MLWSLLKVLIFIAIVAAATLGVGRLTEMGDVALLTAFGREFTLTPLVAIVLALVLLFSVWLLFKAVGLIVATLRFLNGDETAISRYFNRRAERKGFEALAEGMMALAAGEGRLAIRKAERAEKYLKRPELTKLVLAQGAEMAGDPARHQDLQGAGDRRPHPVRRRARADETEARGRRHRHGHEARRKGVGAAAPERGGPDHASAVAGAARGLVRRARDPAKALKAGNVPRDLHKRRDAVLALAHARDAMAEGKIAEATRDATEANRLVPTLVPAAAMAARLAIAENKPKVATNILKAAWATDPHPDLAAAFAEIAPERNAGRAPETVPAADRQAPRPPRGEAPGGRTSDRAEDFPAARRALGDLAETKPTARSLTIMAAIERGEGSSDRIVQAWLARAVTASRGPQWICGNCGHVHAEWRPVCANCESFDTLSWEEAPQSEAALAGPAQMLPLIVGALEDKSAPDVEDADTVEDAATDEPQPDQADRGPNRPRPRPCAKVEVPAVSQLPMSRRSAKRAAGAQASDMKSFAGR